MRYSETKVDGKETKREKLRHTKEIKAAGIYHEGTTLFRNSYGKHREICLHRSNNLFIVSELDQTAFRVISYFY